MSDDMAENIVDLTRFRSDVRQAILDDCPESMRQPLLSDDDACWGGRGWRFRSDDQRQWFERAVARGWTAPGWPREYGGGALDAERAEVLRDEMAALGCRLPLAGWGLTLLGPTLLHFGTEEQKRRFLPATARGEIRWCQGFSEPGAGSDLAALQTRAEPRDGVFVVNGQKIWTTYGHVSDWIFCLVRTDREAPKHLGISFLLIDMASPGITVRPIPLISGTSEFCEVFFDDVRVPDDNLVGPLNRGWDVAKYLLGRELEVSGKVKAQAAASVGQTLTARGVRLDAVARVDIAKLDIEAWGLSALIEESAALAQAGLERPGLGAAVKYVGSELNKWRFEAQMEQLGADALLWAGSGPEDGALSRAWLRTKANSIAGGSAEMQLNMIAKRVLGLPGKPSARAGGPASNDLSEDHRQIRTAIRGTLAAARGDAAVRAVRGTPAHFDSRLWGGFAEAGYAGLLVPTGAGGAGLGHTEASIVMQELGRALVPSPFLATAILGATALAPEGGAGLGELLPSIADGSRLFALAVDEGRKHNPDSMGLAALTERDGIVLDGVKRTVADGGNSDVLIVAAVEQGATSLFLVDRRAAGVEVVRTQLIDDRDWADIRFNGVRLDPAGRLGEPHSGHALLASVLGAGRAATAGELLGIGDEACDQTVAYLQTRRQFDHQLAEYQALQHRLAMVHIRLDLARAALRKAVRLLDGGDDGAPSAVAAAKHIAIGAATLAVQEAVQMHGGVGMTDALDIGFMMKRVRVLSELYGDAPWLADGFAARLGY